MIRGFFRFLARRGLVENAAVLALRNPKIPKSVPRALSEAEAMDALDNIGELEGEPWIAKRDVDVEDARAVGDLRGAGVLPHRHR